MKRRHKVAASRKSEKRGHKRPAAKQPTRTGKRRAVAAEWELRLYVAGQSARSLAAIGNLKQICEDHLKGRYRIRVIDLLVNPRLAHDDQIVAIPTLIRKLPVPMQRLIGDLSDTARTLVGLQIRASIPAQATAA